MELTISLYFTRSPTGFFGFRFPTFLTSQLLNFFFTAFQLHYMHFIHRENLVTSTIVSFGEALWDLLPNGPVLGGGAAKFCLPGERSWTSQHHRQPAWPG